MAKEMAPPAVNTPSAGVTAGLNATAAAASLNATAASLNATAAVTEASLNATAAVTVASLNPTAAVTAGTVSTPSAAIVGESLTNIKEYTSTAILFGEIQTEDKTAADYHTNLNDSKSTAFSLGEIHTGDNPVDLRFNNEGASIVGESLTNLKEYTSTAILFGEIQTKDKIAADQTNLNNSKSATISEYNNEAGPSERDFDVEDFDDGNAVEVVQMIPLLVRSDSSESDFDVEDDDDVGLELVQMLPYVHQSPPPANVAANLSRKFTSYFLDLNDLRNIFPVTVSFPLLDEIPLSKRCFSVKGRDTLERIGSDLLHRLWLDDCIANPMCPADFRTHTSNESIPGEAMMGQVLKRNGDDSCGLFLVCYLGIHQADEVFGEI